MRLSDTLENCTTDFIVKVREYSWVFVKTALGKIYRAVSMENWLHKYSAWKMTRGADFLIRFLSCNEHGFVMDFRH